MTFFLLILLLVSIDTRICSSDNILSPMNGIASQTKVAEEKIEDVICTVKKSKLTRNVSVQKILMTMYDTEFKIH